VWGKDISELYDMMMIYIYMYPNLWTKVCDAYGNGGADFR
jgi:hypothetical protein